MGISLVSRKPRMATGRAGFRDVSKCGSDLAALSQGPWRCDLGEMVSAFHLDSERIGVAKSHLQSRRQVR